MKETFACCEVREWLCVPMPLGFVDLCASLALKKPGEGHGARTGAGKGRGLSANDLRNDRIWALVTTSGSGLRSRLAEKECLLEYRLNVGILSPSPSSTASGASDAAMSASACSSKALVTGADDRRRCLYFCSFSAWESSRRRQNSCADSWDDFGHFLSSTLSQRSAKSVCSSLLKC